MRKALIIAVLALLIVFSACEMNEDKTDATEPTEDGIMTEIEDDDGNVTGYERRYHNDYGDITRLDVYDEDQTYLYFVLYDYYDDHKLYTETRYKAEGFAEYRYVYTYDDDGNLTEKAYELPHGEAELYRYDADGNEIERLYYGTDEQLVKREVLEDGEWVNYDTDGNIMQ